MNSYDRNVVVPDSTFIFIPVGNNCEDCEILLLVMRKRQTSFLDGNSWTTRFHFFSFSLSFLKVTVIDCQTTSNINQMTSNSNLLLCCYCILNNIQLTLAGRCFFPFSLSFLKVTVIYCQMTSNINQMTSNINLLLYCYCILNNFQLTLAGRC